jgi:hypothetical protein
MSEMEENYKGYLEYELGRYQIPGYMRAGLIRYIMHGIEPGDFLRHLLCNDLMGTIGKADSTNINFLPNYAKFLYNTRVGYCYGSPHRYEQWIAKGGAFPRNPDDQPLEPL